MTSPLFAASMASWMVSVLLAERVRARQGIAARNRDNNTTVTFFIRVGPQNPFGDADFKCYYTNNGR